MNSVVYDYTDWNKMAQQLHEAATELMDKLTESRFNTDKKKPAGVSNVDTAGRIHQSPI